MMCMQCTLSMILSVIHKLWWLFKLHACKLLLKTNVYSWKHGADHTNNINYIGILLMKYNHKSKVK